jgi:hypothetical protein
MTLTLRRTQKTYRGCPVITRTVNAIEYPEDYERWIDQCRQIALKAGSGSKYSQSMRATEIVRFGACDCLRYMAEAAGWDCPPLKRMQGTAVNSVEDIDKLASLVSEANHLFLQRPKRTPLNGGAEASKEWMLAEAIIEACLTAGDSIKMDSAIEAQLRVSQLLFSYLSVEAGKRDPAAERKALRAIRTGFVKLLRRISA